MRYLTRKAALKERKVYQSRNCCFQSLVFSCVQVCSECRSGRLVQFQLGLREVGGVQVQGCRSRPRFLSSIYPFAVLILGSPYND